MKRFVITLLLVTCLGFGRNAWAVVESCRNVANGVPCVGPCVVAGVCMTQTCVGMARPDMTGCSSGNHCTTDDFCLAGVCQPGPTQISCPAVDADSCTVAICEPSIGCTTQFICDATTAPDLTAIEAAVADSALQDSSGIEADSALQDSSAMQDSSASDAETMDGSTGRDANDDALFRNVRGSNVGGCTCGISGGLNPAPKRGIGLLSFSILSIVVLGLYARRRGRSRLT